MLSRILTRSLPPARPAPATVSRSLSSRSARARRRQPITVRGTSKPTTTTSSSPLDDILSPRPRQSPSSSSHLLDNDDPLNLKGTRPEPPAIRFFEQDVSQIGESAPRPVSAQRIAADERTAEQLWSKISKLEREIQQLERDDELEATVMRLRAVERDRVGAADVEMLADADPAAVRAELDGLRIAAPEGRGGGGEEGVALERLNNCLRHAYLATDKRKRVVVRSELWKMYKRAKMRVPDMLAWIPPPAWDILFYSQAVRWKSNEKREEHMRELLADMRSVGLEGPPTPPPDGKVLDAD
ncbi:hypothetical protein B0J12DRAFT_323717 [Macrophomina phaseolina]|uniref:Uncharacterized protein n=1 Tax=Macrophomina phaseolina TaxID=35725 RepID=A0ABQ8FW25_9PEZI|nr:hypothetical protein B0J12DRAFT_323717 [Macrophomina phaseolina]